MHATWWRNGLVAALAAFAVGRTAPSDDPPRRLEELAGTGRVVSVDTLRAGARSGDESGLLVRRVVRCASDGTTLRHVEYVLPAMACVVHLVEEDGLRGRRLVYRETTRARGRTLRVVAPRGEADDSPFGAGVAEGFASSVTYGEGATLRREFELAADTVLPLERRESERSGSATPGPFRALDPLSGAVEDLVARRHVVVLRAGLAGYAVPLVIWEHTQPDGRFRSLAAFVGGAMVLEQPAPGLPTAERIPPELFDALRDRVLLDESPNAANAHGAGVSANPRR